MYGTIESAALRQCVFCGKIAPRQLSRCPSCREALPDIRVYRSWGDGRVKVRRGLLYMLLAGVIYYFSSEYSPMPPPVPIPLIVTTYLSPFLFLCGLGLCIYGLYLRNRD